MSTAAPVQLTPQAMDKVREFLASSAEGYLRLGVRGGGCSGFQYVLALDHRHEDDLHWSQEEIEVVMRPDALPYLQGATLVYRDDLEQSGFDFENPNAYSSCGCGSSFRLKPYDGCGSSSGAEDALYDPVYED